MGVDDTKSNDMAADGLIPVKVPFIWPDARVLSGLADYQDHPPSRQFFKEAELISGLIVGTDDGTVRWIDELLRLKSPPRLCLVVVLIPAGPTREEHLQAIDMLRQSTGGAASPLDIRLLPLPSDVDGDCRRPMLPPTIIQAHNTQTGRTVMGIGSVGDSGHDRGFPGGLNFVFQPDDTLRDAWRRWFQYAFSSASRLTAETLKIPYLVPAQGDPDAALQWAAFERACMEKSGVSSRGPSVDIETGEVITDTDGQDTVPWDDGQTQLDPLALEFQQVYANGWLVTVDEATRIKPLTVPVKAALLGQQAARTVGTVKQKQSFSLQVLEDDVEKHIENCRKIGDLIELLTYPLSQGNRWLPVAAKDLLEKDLELRNAEGHRALAKALGGDITKYVAERQASIRGDLNNMYKQLGQGDAVPSDKLQLVLHTVEVRLRQALEARITPRVVYNRIAAPDLTAGAPEENWSQPLSLLSRSARALRESFTDIYFPRNFARLSFKEDDFRKACNVFDDKVTQPENKSKAAEELKLIDEILDANSSAREKCHAIWRLSRGCHDEPARPADS